MLKIVLFLTMIFVLLLMSVGSFASPVLLQSRDLNSVSGASFVAKALSPYGYTQEQLQKYNELQERHEDTPLWGKALLQLIKLRRLFSRIPGDEPPDDPNSHSQIFTGKKSDHLPTLVMLPPKQKTQSSEEPKKTADDWVREARSAVWHSDNETENKEYIKRCLYRALELEPDHRSAWTQLSFELSGQRIAWQDWLRIAKLLTEDSKFMLKGDYFSKQQCLKQSLETGGGRQPEVWFELAQVQQLEKDKIACLDRVVEINPNHMDALIGLAELYKGKKEEIGYLRAALKSKPSDLSVMRRLTHLLEDRAELKSLWVEILKRDSKDEVAWFQLASLLKEVEEISIGNQKFNSLRCLMKHRELVGEVSEELSRAIQNSIFRQLKHCEQLMQSGKNQEALALALECLKIDVSSGKMWNRVGRILEEIPSGHIMISGRRYAPKDCYVKAIELSPEYGYGWMNLAGNFPAVSQIMVAGKAFSRLACAVQAIEYQAGHTQDSDAIARMHLIIATSLGQDETVMIQGRSWTAAELLEQAVRIGRSQGLLARMYAPGVLSPEAWESVRLQYASDLSSSGMELIRHNIPISNLDGTAVSPIDLMLKAIEFASEEERFWVTLSFGMLAVRLESVQIAGQSYTHKQVCEKAIRLKKDHEKYQIVPRR